MTNLGTFFEGQVRAYADDRAFWERFAAWRIQRTCGVEHASGEKCVVSPGHRGMHVLTPAEGETALRYFNDGETGEPRTLSPGRRLWRDGAGLASIPRNDRPHEHDRVLGAECLCNVGAQECQIHPARPFLRGSDKEGQLAFRKAWDARVDEGRKALKAVFGGKA